MKYDILNMKESYLRGRFFTNSYYCFFLLFALSVTVRWFYLAQRSYYIIFPDLLYNVYTNGQQYSMATIMRNLFVNLNCGFLEAVRPFISALLYTIALKSGAFAHPWLLIIVSIILSSLSIPLYYIIIARLFGTTIALFSTFVLIWLPNFIEQSLAINSISTGAIFLIVSIFFIVDCYQKHRLQTLYFAAFFLAMASVCRYEYVLLVPSFILYTAFFDKRTKSYLKIIAWFISLSGAIYIVLSNYRLRGDLFWFVKLQHQVAMASGQGPVSVFEALVAIWSLLNSLMPWPLWISGVCGIWLITARYKIVAGIAISPFIVHCTFLFFKIKTGTIWPDQSYFLLTTLFIIPFVFLFWEATLKVLCLRNKHYVYIFLFMMTMLLVVMFNFSNLKSSSDNTKYPPALVAITEDVAHKIGSSLVYIYYDPDTFPNAMQAYSLLFYLKRDPIRYVIPSAKDINEKVHVLAENRIRIDEKEYYLLIAKQLISRVIADRQILKMDYDKIGLYQITNF